MTAQHRSLLYLLPLFALACQGQKEQLDNQTQEVVFGEDDRLDVYEYPDESWRALARRSVVAMFRDWDLDQSDPENVQIPAATLGESYALCADQRFRDQPSAASCSGTLVDDDLILTAGHCVNESDCGQTSFLFDFYYEAPGQLAHISSESVYHCQQVLSWALSDDGTDFAVVRLDRPVDASRQPVSIFRGESPPDPGSEVIMLGFPSGIPAKITPNGRVIRHRGTFFEATLDAFGGNSGSGVFNANQELVGVLVRGHTDYGQRGGCNAVNFLPEDLENGESITNIQAALTDCGSGALESAHFCEGESGSWCFPCSEEIDCAEGFSCYHQPDLPGAGSCVAACQAPEECRADHLCVEGQCRPRLTQECQGDDLWTQNSCGYFLNELEPCSAQGQGCFEGECRDRDPGDLCSSAISIHPESQIIEGSLGLIVSDAFHSSCGAGAQGPDHVYHFHVDEEMDFTAWALGYDTVLHLRRDCADQESEVACNDDSVPPGSLGSRLTAHLMPGDYFLVLDAYQVETKGEYLLILNFGGICEEICRPDASSCAEDGNLYHCSESADGCFSWSEAQSCAEEERCYVDSCIPQLPGDLCADAIPIVAESGSFQDSTEGHQHDSNGSCGGAGPDKVYSFELQRQSRVSATASGFDTVLYLAQDCANELVCVDDSTPPGGVGSQIEMELSPGVYQLFVDGYNQAGDFQLDLNFEVSCEDACAQGETRCASDWGYYECIQGSTGCMEWSSALDCGEQICRGGSCVEPQQISVPGDFETLEEAIHGIEGDNTILSLGPGEFLANLTLARPIIIRGAGRHESIIRGFFDIQGASLHISDVTLSGRYEDARTQGIMAHDAHVTLVRSTVQETFTGLLASNSEVYAMENLFDGNNFAIKLENSSGYLFNNLISNNDLKGIDTQGGSLLITNNTLSGNGFAAQDEEMGAALFAHEGSDNILNNIIVGNMRGFKANEFSGYEGYNNIWGNVEDYVGEASGDNDISVDPLFVDPGEWDFRLLEDSPCIDSAYDVGLYWDILGNQRPWGEGFDMGAFEFVRSESSGSLILNEVMANPRDEGTGEYVEIYNGSDQVVDLQGFMLDDEDSTSVLLPWQQGSTLLPAGGYALVLDPDYAGEYEIPAETLLFTVEGTRISNGLAISDPVHFLDPEGFIISSYGNPFNPGNGVSAERISPELMDDPSAWQASPCAASPGAPNCATEPPPVIPGDYNLLITEVMSNPLDENSGEYVEILNLGDQAVEMAGLILSDGDSDDSLIPWEEEGGSLLEPGQYAVVFDPDYDGLTYSVGEGALWLGIENTRLGDGLATTDPISLWDPGLNLLASYSQPFNPGNGRSAEMVNLELGDVPDNWIAAPCPEAPFASPGAENCVASGGNINPADLTLLINEVMANPLDEDTGEFIELYNYGDEPVDPQGLILDDGDASDVLTGESGALLAPGAYALVLDPEYTGEYALPEGVLILYPSDTSLGSGLSTNDPISLKAPDGITLLSSFSFPFNPGNGTSVERLGDLGDVPENWLASSCAGGSSPGRSNCISEGGGQPIGEVSLIINEVMANPLDESSGEFVELRNMGDDPVDLQGFLLSDGDSVDSIEGYQGGPTMLPAGGWALILDQDYSAQYTIPEATLLLTVDDRTIGSGLTNDDPIELLMPDGFSLIDSYSFPFNPGNGLSVEKIDPLLGDVAENWAASCAETGSTPGAPNCAGEGGGVEPQGQMIDLNSADSSLLQELRGIGPTLGSRILAFREANGTFEDLNQLLAISGVRAGYIEDWSRLEEGEEYYLGISEELRRPTQHFNSVAELMASLPSPESPGAMDGIVVRIRRVVNRSAGDEGHTRMLFFSDWGDEGDYSPSAQEMLPVYLGSHDRSQLATVDALADWERSDGEPNSGAAFYRWESPMATLPVNHVYAVEGLLHVWGGQWELKIRTQPEPGLDRLVRIERWLAPELWRELEVIWSYNYSPALVHAEEFDIGLPYRLVNAHPCMDWWLRMEGSRPSTPRRRNATDNQPGAYYEFNDALALWLDEGQFVEVPRAVINEIFYDNAAVADREGEFIELFNPNPEALSLEGWRIEDDNGGYTFGEDAPALPAWGFLVLGNNPEWEVIDFSYGQRLSLRNSSEGIRLFDTQARLVDEVIYNQEAPWPVGHDGFSIELFDPCSNNTIGENWEESSEDWYRFTDPDQSREGSYYMTPGTYNSNLISSCPGDWN